MIKIISKLKYILIILVLCYGSVCSANAVDTEELYSILNEATSIAGWFNGSSSVIVEYDENDVIIGESGREYAKITGEINTMQKLKEKLETYFSSEIVDYYFETNPESKRFIDVNGYLYYLKDFNSTAQRINRPLSSSDSKLEILSSDTNYIKFRLTVEGDMGTKNSYDYVLAIKNNSYVFTNYVLPSDIGHKNVPGVGIVNPQTSDTPIITVCALAISAAAAAIFLKKRKH